MRQHVARNLLDTLAGRKPTTDYDGYGSCPLTVERGKIILAEFGYGGKVAPPFSRTFMGGENDVRGFEFYSITPVAYIPSNVAVGVLNPDGSPRTQKTLVGGYLQQTPVSQNAPIYQIITPGGDTQGIFNFEYRIPIFRVASSGISQLVNGSGSLTAMAPCPGDGAMISGALELSSAGRLPLDRWLAPAASGLTGLVILLLLLGSRKNTRPQVIEETSGRAEPVHAISE